MSLSMRSGGSRGANSHRHERYPGHQNWRSFQEVSIRKPLLSTDTNEDSQHVDSSVNFRVVDLYPILCILYGLCRLRYRSPCKAIELVVNIDSAYYSLLCETALGHAYIGCQSSGGR